ncbi:MAG: tRNA dihydrouridine(20/20a) synthase DusA [Gammaproteobacteria bacterium]|nr:MAG: tRNA dihydrouridine(20/20a) synthase DusA [Gammaproteobacteria bacterium]
MPEVGVRQHVENKGRMRLNQPARFSIAPMMELTDRHFRYLARLMTRESILYTEMLTSRAVIHGDRPHLLDYNAVEQPLVLQLGGSDPSEMAEAARIGEAWGYREINVNVGCPSDRVQAGRFGACLMAEPDLVADMVKAMQRAVSIPVTVKCRLGVDRDDSYEVVADFVARVADAGCEHFIVHARKAWLDGLSPKENRSVPPLRYEYVYRLKRERPDLFITINGGVTNWEAVTEHWQQVDGVMSGRTAYHHPAFLMSADAMIARVDDARRGHDSVTSPQPPTTAALADVARRYAVYIQARMEQGVRPSIMTRHLVALFQEVPGARLWRRHISENVSSTDDAVKLVDDALVPILDGAQRGGGLSRRARLVR